MSAPSAIVVGGSVAGLAAGLALRSLDWRVTILERSKGSLEDRGAGLGLDLPVLNAVLGRAPDAPLPAVHMIGREVAAWDGGPGEPGVYIEPARFLDTTWGVLYRSLYDRFDGDLVEGERAIAVRDGEEAAAVELADGRWLTADLVIGADGYRSAVRRAVTPEHYDATYAGYVLWRGLLDESTLADAVRERFFDDRLHVFSRPPYHLVIYPVPGPAGRLERGSRRLNWGWYLPAPENDLPRLFGRLATDDLRTVPVGHVPDEIGDELLQEARRSWPEPWLGVIEQTVLQRKLFAAGIFEYEPHRLVRGRLALAGDAAHTASPITGSGARFALLDALALRQAITRHDNGDGNVEDALHCYEQTRLSAGRGLVQQGRTWGHHFLSRAALPASAR